MKHLLLMLIGIATLSIAHAQDDQAQVLQKCIDFQPLQRYYPRDERGAITQLNIMQHGVSFPENINVSKNGKRPVFLSKKQVTQSKEDAYFLFHEFTITDASAKVAFIYHYSEADQLVVNIELEKAGTIWTIKKSNASNNHETE